ncbi:unnamed protein product [Ectocarpus sp. 4 AP-2014]
MQSVVLLFCWGGGGEVASTRMRNGWRERRVAGVLGYKERQQSFCFCVWCGKRANSMQYHVSRRRKGGVHGKNDDNIAL